MEDNQTDPSIHDPSVILDSEESKNHLEELRKEQSYPMGLIWGLAASLIGAAAWALVSIITGYSLGLIAVGIGYVVGHAVRLGGKGIDQGFGIMAGALALIGCVIGDFAGFLAAVAKEMDFGMYEIIEMYGIGQTVSIFFQEVGVIGYLLFSFAVYEAYKFAFRKLEEN